MTEEPGKYEVPGKAAPAITPARAYELLAVARTAMITKQLRHDRKAPRSKTARDREFHERESKKAKDWLTETGVWMEQLSRQGNRI